MDLGGARPNHSIRKKTAAVGQGERKNATTYYNDTYNGRSPNADMFERTSIQSRTRSFG